MNFSQILLFSLFFLIFPSKIKSNDKSVWVTAWSMNSPEKIDKMLNELSVYKFNKVFIQTRYRADALYIPNKKDSTYPNPECLCYLIKDSVFDPLEYTILKAKNYNIKVFAWVTTFVATPHDLNKISPKHIYNVHPEWFLQTYNGKIMSHENYEGAFLDPALPEVREYLLNIFSDIVKNYDLDGIQLDYIRYPDSIYGWNSESRMLKQTQANFDFAKYKQDRVSSFMNYVYINLKNIKPEIEISAAVIAKLDKAKNLYSQDWEKWLHDYYLDKVYVMAYNTSNKSFASLMKNIRLIKVADKKIVVVLRTWQGDKPYHYSKINEKLSIARINNFREFGYYNYTGLTENGYISNINY
ncbi:MAG: hypothetical protein AUJ98_00425 [Bacteroidetes bacterium CG2_30_33_31]|nr:MAG: hypothetical protein AUJ98_00425 [Bacteroidetes bacterium CG2_30_33_31]